MPAGQMRRMKQCGSRRLKSFMWQWINQESRSRLNRIIATEMAKLLDCACLFWRFGCDDMSLCARNQSTSRMKKRQKGQPHSTTLARGSHNQRNTEAFAPCGSAATVPIEISSGCPQKVRRRQEPTIQMTLARGRRPLFHQLGKEARHRERPNRKRADSSLSSCRLRR